MKTLIDSNNITEIAKKRLDKKLSKILRNAKSENTRKAYKNDFQHFKQWCNTHGYESLPSKPEALKYYLVDNMDEYALSTLKRRLASISTIHKLAEFDNPVQNELVKQVIEGIKRTKKQNKTQKKPLLTKHLKLICRQIPSNTKGIRDKAILLLGFAGGFRRSELVGLDTQDITFLEEGIKVTVHTSKTDQEGKGIKKGITFGTSRLTCPVLAVKKWLSKSGINSGPVFRPVDRHENIKSARLSSRAIALIVKNYIENIGLNPNEYSGHSLRSGTVTQAALNDVSILSIMDQTGHQSQRTVKEYYRNANIFKNNASSKLGL